MSHEAHHGLMRPFSDSDRKELKGKVLLTNGEVLDVEGARLCEEGHTRPGEPYTRSTQCRIWYYKLADGSFMCRARQARVSVFEYSQYLPAGTNMRKRQRSVSPPTQKPPTQKPPEIHVLAGAELARVEA